MLEQTHDALDHHFAANPRLDLRCLTTCVRHEAAVHWAAWGAAGGLLAAVLFAAISRAIPLLPQTPRTALSLLAAGASGLLAFAAGFGYPRSRSAIARMGDARLCLRDRLATAVEIEEDKLTVPGEIAARQRADANGAAACAQLKEVFRPRLTGRQGIALAILAALLWVGLAIPNPQDAVLAHRVAEAQAVSAQAERLEELREQIEGDPTLGPEDRAALVIEIESTLADLEGMDAERAMARLAQAEERLQALQPPPSPQLADALERAGVEMSQGGETAAAGQALTQQDAEAAALALEALADRLASGQVDAANQEQTAQTLEQAAEGAQEALPELADALHEAAQALADGQAAQAAEAMERAAEAIREAGQEIAAQRAADRLQAELQDGRRQIAQSLAASQQAGTQPGSSTAGSGSTPGASMSTTPAAGADPIATHAPGSASVTPYEPIYAPERLGPGDGEVVALPSQGSEGPATGETGSQPPTPDEVRVPYNQVYVEYEQQAIRVLDDGTIPSSMQEYVRSYFSSLDPGR